jgi:hypothetical protein
VSRDIFGIGLILRPQILDRHLVLIGRGCVVPGLCVGGGPFPGGGVGWAAVWDLLIPAKALAFELLYANRKKHCKAFQFAAILLPKAANFNGLFVHLVAFSYTKPDQG